MNKSELAEKLAAELEVSASRGQEIVNAFVSVVTQALSRDESVQITGFGTFAPTERAARTGRNPATGAALEIAASSSVKFTVGSALKNAVNTQRKK
ncbi:HU family DNA-binding protein [Chitinasiproducens palmae]|uniref:DNA-binding protein HU-beta n=1 Tax=Chitinasiproducens palmae TaxID=1770053 RepID=A0A1H2PVV0_9BURK|nr:HU family DNA-binding protein [Chitinasiproducens palmae]SDV51439.1 DNA-binding protein HU-beta [Chitinasiproducens palmae]